MKTNIRSLSILLALSILLCCTSILSFAEDTDIYQSNVKQNAYVLLDSSGSMSYGVYQSNIDYAAMYDYLFTLNDNYSYSDYIYDAVQGDNTFYNNNTWPRRRIYLMPGEIGISKRTDKNGDIHLYSGDAADPSYLWHVNDMIDTYTDIDDNGNLIAGDPNNPQLLTVDSDGYILFKGNRLPLSQDIQYRHRQVLYGGGVIEDGFGDLLNAPGYYFSGYTSGPTGGPTAANGSESTAYFFVTGNWFRMQSVYNLEYTTRNPDPQGASQGDPAWKFEHFPIDYNEWPLLNYALDVPPGDVNYQPNIEETKIIVQQGAAQIRLHFELASFDINSTKIPGWPKPVDTADWLIISSADGKEVARYNNDTISNWDGWTPNIEGDTVRVTLVSGSQNQGLGYFVDQLAYNDDAQGYLMKNRLGVATKAILNTIDEFRGKINWGTFTFPAQSGDGATSQQVINPTLNDDVARQNIASNFNNITASGGTPIGEALQDVFEVGYYQHRNSIDNLPCRKNYAIVLSDGFPSLDNNWSLIDDINADPHLPFQDWDEDGFTADPYQYDNPPANYYDDVAHWLYNHSWHDKSEVDDPANSYENVSSHQISFGFQNPLMQDAADEAGGMFITAYNEGQLNAAFYAIALSIAQSVSFTTPAVSVDAANKLENGNDIYTGLFFPVQSNYWLGNIRKFQYGDGSALRPEFWGIYDASNQIAVDSNNEYKDNTDGFWGDENDSNDRDNYGSQDILEDGVGEVLTESLLNAYNSGNYYNRNIKTFINNSTVDFNRLNVTPDHFGLAATNTQTRDKAINWIYGYSFEADAITGNPIIPRSWALGAIIHSQPKIIDYYSNDLKTLSARYIAVGADDGMLHIFNEQTGVEIFAFVPADILPRVPLMETEFHTSMVDGLVSLYKESGQPKYLFFGLRRGGRSYWRIDISNPDPNSWTAAQLTDPDMGQSWSEVQFARIRTDKSAYTDVAIVSGGYDPAEDNYPEPFTDLDNNGTPYTSNGSLDNKEWSKTNPEQDVNANNLYDIYNKTGNNSGNGIYVIDIHSLQTLFSVKYDDSNDVPTINTFSDRTNQTRTDMKYCFPATPSVVTLSEQFSYDNGGDIVYKFMTKALKAIYAPDIYGNIFRITYDYDSGKQWQVKHIFSANPASENLSGDVDLWQNDIVTDAGRKVFFGPAVSWSGSGSYFDARNYSFPNVDFYNRDRIASLFFGTGDREHPNYTMISNRVYAIYDDSPVYAMDTSKIEVSSAPYKESDLLNITCDELGINTTLANSTDVQNANYKHSLEVLLRDDATTSSNLALELASGAGENDAKGWFIRLDQQGLSPFCDHCSYPAVVDSNKGGRDYHYGEKVLNKLLLFNGALFFGTYQSSVNDPCVPQGNGFNYALNYLNGAAALNLNALNDKVEADGTLTQLKDVTDRYGKFKTNKLPSTPEVIIRGNDVRIIDNEEDKKPPKNTKPINLYYWLER